MSDFIVGLDLGQAQDYTALAIAERTYDAQDAARYQVRHLQRFPLGARYPDIVAEVRSTFGRVLRQGESCLVVDATGVGRPVVELLEEAELGPVAVTITGGTAVTQDDRSYHVPKRDLVSAVQVLLQSGRLKVAEALAHAPLLVKELLAFRVKITTDAHDIYGAWRDGTHDDLVLAVALVCWYGEAHSVVKVWGSSADAGPRRDALGRPVQNGCGDDVRKGVTHLT